MHRKLAVALLAAGAICMETQVAWAHPGHPGHGMEHGWEPYVLGLVVGGALVAGTMIAAPSLRQRLIAVLLRRRDDR